MELLHQHLCLVSSFGVSTECLSNSFTKLCLALLNPHSATDIIWVAGLSEVFMTGGIPPGITLQCAAELAYHNLYRYKPGSMLHQKCIIVKGLCPQTAC